MYWFKILLGITAAFLLCACRAGPDYVPPKMIIPSDYKEIYKNSDKYWKTAAPQDGCDRGAWWKIFNDSVLNNLESQLIISNQTIAAAKANYQQARALVNEARASYFPLLKASATITRQNQSDASSSNASTPANAPTSDIINSHALLLDASWEPDIWDSTRRSVESSDATAEAAAAHLELVRLSASASLAQFYFELRAIDTDQKLLDQLVKNNQILLTLTQNRYHAGVAELTDVIQAQTQFQTAQAQAINNGINRAKLEHAIAVLIGQPPAFFTLLPSPLGRIFPPEIPVEVPSVLLERRPDIAEAERQVAAANAKIGIATAAFYPIFTLSATGNLQDRGFSHWFSLPSLVWAVGPTLAETLFDGGARSAAKKAAIAGHDAAASNYRQTVLSAFQEVEDNLAALRILTSESTIQKQAADSARLALKLVTNQYKAGTASYSDVIAAQITAFTAEKNAADTNGLRMTTAVGLIKALGGGWNQQEILR